MRRLNEIKAETLINSYNLTNATKTETEIFLNEIKALEISKEYFGYLIEQKILTSNPDFLNMTAQEIDALIQQATALGVSESALATLSAQKIIVSNKDFAEMTFLEVQALIQESGASELAGKMINFLALQKKLADTDNLVKSTSAETEEFIKLANAAGIASEEIMLLREKQAIAAKYENNPTLAGIGMTDEEKAIWNKELIITAPKYSASDLGGNFGLQLPSSKSSKDPHKEAFDEWYKRLKHQLSLNLISEQEFLDKLDAKYKVHYANKSKYLDEYEKHELEVYQGRAKLAESTLLKEIEIQKSAYDTAKDNRNPESQSKSLEEQISLYKKLQSAEQDLQLIYLNRGFSSSNIEIQESQLKAQEYTKQIKALNKQSYDDRLSLSKDYIEKRNYYEDWGTDNEVNAWKRVYAYTQEFYAQGKLSAEEFYQYAEEINRSLLESGKRVFELDTKPLNESIDDAKDRLSELKDAYGYFDDKQVSDRIANLNEQFDEQVKVANAVADKIQLLNNLHADGAIPLNDYKELLEALTDAQREELSVLTALDKQKQQQIDLVTDAYYSYNFDKRQEQIDLLKDQLKEIEDSYKSQMDLIDDEIDALKEKNDIQEKEEERQKRLLELEKLRLELENARNEKNIRQIEKFDDGTYDFIFVADQDKIKNLEDNIANKQSDLDKADADEALNAQIKALEARKDGLKDQMESEKSTLQDMIDRLQGFLDLEQEKYANRNKLTIESVEELRERLKLVNEELYSEQLAYMDTFNQAFVALLGGADIEQPLEELRLAQKNAYGIEKTDIENSEADKELVRGKAIKDQKTAEGNKNTDLKNMQQNFLQGYLTKIVENDKAVKKASTELFNSLLTIDNDMYTERLKALNQFIDSWNAQISRMESASISGITPSVSSPKSTGGTVTTGGVSPVSNAPKLAVGGKIKEMGYAIVDPNEQVLTEKATKSAENIVEKLTEAAAPLDKLIKLSDLSPEEYEQAVGSEWARASRLISENLAKNPDYLSTSMSGIVREQMEGYVKSLNQTIVTNQNDNSKSESMVIHGGVNITMPNVRRTEDIDFKLLEMQIKQKVTSK